MTKHTKKRAMALFMAAVLAGSTLYGGAADAASAIKLNKKTAKITAGKSITLKVRGTKKKVKWKSSKKSVATVSAKGKVTGKKAGKAVITAKVKGKTLKCKVTVTKKTAAKQSTSKKTSSKKTTSNKTTSTDSLAMQKKVISIVNKNRKAKGLSELKMDDKLMKAAQARAKELTKSFSHTRPNGESCFTIFKKYDINAGFSGENIAAGQRSAADVMESWMNSQGHKENIMNKNFKKIGVGLVIVPDDMYSYYWVQMFTD